MRLVLGGALVLSVAVLGACAIGVTGPAVVELRGDRWEVPIPSPHLRIGGGSGHAGYLVLGDRDLAAFWAAEAPRYGWRFDEQMGSGYLLSHEQLRLVATRQQRYTSFIVRLDLTIAP